MGEHWGDRDELVELISRYTDMADLPDWDELPQRVFADQVEWDFSTFGAPPAVFDRDVLVARLRKAFDTSWAAAHHSVTGHQIRVDGDRATIHVKLRSEQWLRSELAGDGPSRWLVVGFYDDEAVRTPDGWRLSKVRLTVTHQENLELLAIANR